MVSKILYGLMIAVLNKNERRRLDRFQAQCFRRVLKVQLNYDSRVSNTRVLMM